jgi:hypothetical protein
MCEIQRAKARTTNTMATFFNALPHRITRHSRNYLRRDWNLVSLRVRYCTFPQSVIVTRAEGLPLREPTASIFLTTS